MKWSEHYMNNELINILKIYLLIILIDFGVGLFRLVAIVSEIGIINSINGLRVFVIAKFRKIIRIQDASNRILDSYMIGVQDYKFINLIIRPSLIIEYVGAGIVILAGIIRGMSLNLPFDQIDRGRIENLIYLDFSPAEIFNRRRSVIKKLPIITNILFLLKFHFTLIMKTICFRRDSFGVLALTKLMRLVILEIILFFLILKFVGEFF
jgi:hypothetical protein